jgi:hypothetical protein
MTAVEPVDRLAYLSRSEAIGRVLRREHRGHVIRWRIAEYAPRRRGVEGTAVRLERLDHNSASQPSGYSYWMASSALIEAHRLYGLEARS